MGGGCKINHAALGNIRNSQSSSVRVLKWEHMCWGEGRGRGLDMHQFNGGRMEDIQRVKHSWPGRWDLRLGA